MYNGHIYCEEYWIIKDKIIDYLNGETNTLDIEAIENQLQDLYENNEIPTTQYDELMGYLQDIEY